jgi:hypothetical protein
VNPEPLTLNPEADMWTGTPLFPEQASTMAGRVDNLYFFLLAISIFFSLLIAGSSSSTPSSTGRREPNSRRRSLPRRDAAGNHVDGDPRSLSR